MTELATLAHVDVSTVSNWRRRHESFPRSRRQGGQQVFSVAEVTDWLGNRKIARNDLEDHEVPGTTYGDRLRRGLPTDPPAPSAPFLADLWKELSRLRGLEDDVEAYADLVLGLLYLSAQEPESWSQLVASDSFEKLSWLLHRGSSRREQELLRRSWSSIEAGTHGARRVSEIIHTLARVVRPASRPRRWVGEIFDDLLNRFATADGKRVGEMVTPRSVVRVLVETTAAEPGESVLDPVVGTGAFLLQAARSIEARGGRTADLLLAGQAMRERSLWTASMNLDLHGVLADLANRPAIAIDTDVHANRRFDVILANPPFNMVSTFGIQAGDPRWRFGTPPRNNANFAWLQHIWSSLADDGRAAVVMANSALGTTQGGQDRIRAAMVEYGAVEALIALPSQLFHATAIPVTVWLLKRPHEAGHDEVLFIDAREFGRRISRNQRDLSGSEIDQIAATIRDWRTRSHRNGYQDVRGYSASIDLETIRNNDYQLTPGRYVGSKVVAATSSPSVSGLRQELASLHRRAAELDTAADRALDRIHEWTR